MKRLGSIWSALTVSMLLGVASAGCSAGEPSEEWESEPIGESQEALTGICPHVESKHIAICTTQIGGSSSEIIAQNEMGGTVRFIFSDTYVCKGGVYLGEITVYFPKADKNTIAAALLEHNEVDVYGNWARGFLKNASFEIVD